VSDRVGYGGGRKGRRERTFTYLFGEDRAVESIELVEFVEVEAGLSVCCSSDSHMRIVQSIHLSPGCCTRVQC
jgi:hypothetical protein